MRVCFVLPELSPSGGVRIALGHAEVLAASEENSVDVVVLRGHAGQYRRIEEVAESSYDVAVGTWWETLPVLLRLDATRRVAFIQSAEERFYRGSEPLEQLGAALALSAPVHFFTVTQWLRDLLSQLRPDARTWFVPNGIDKSLFAPRTVPLAAGPLRILIEGQHTLWFKGVSDALRAVNLMQEPHEVTLVALEPAEDECDPEIRVVGGLEPHEMRSEYEQHDVLLKLSRVESLGLPVVEACHVGLPAVVTPFTGHAEVVAHGRNGLVVGFDDPVAVAAALDALARDRLRLRALGEGAVDSMKTWPSQREATDMFAAALAEVVTSPAPDPAAAGAAAFARWRVAATAARVARGEAAVQRRELEGSVEWLEDALAQERRDLTELRQRMSDLTRELTQSRDNAARLIGERDDWLRVREREAADLHDQLDSIKASRTYQAARRLQRIAGWIKH